MIDMNALTPDVSNRRRRLESEIAELLREFESETGTQIRDIEILKIEIPGLKPEILEVTLIFREAD